MSYLVSLLDLINYDTLNGDMPTIQQVHWSREVQNPPGESLESSHIFGPFIICLLMPLKSRPILTGCNLLGGSDAQSKQVAYMCWQRKCCLACMLCSNSLLFCKSDHARGTIWNRQQITHNLQNVPGGVDCPACMERDHVYGPTKWRGWYPEARGEKNEENKEKDKQRETDRQRQRQRQLNAKREKEKDRQRQRQPFVCTNCAAQCIVQLLHCKNVKIYV